MTITIHESEIEAALKIIKDGNWKGAVDAVKSHDTTKEIMTAEEAGIMMAKLVALAIPGAANIVLGLEILHTLTPFMIYAFKSGLVKPADYGDPVWEAPTGPGPGVSI